MPKEFFTEKDIEDLFKRGVMSLQVSDNVVLTELAYEKAGRLGMKLIKEKPDNPPSAPVRPYLSQAAAPKATSSVFDTKTETPASTPAGGAAADDLHLRIRSAVQARLGSQVDSALLDVIIRRVLNSVGVK